MNPGETRIETTAAPIHYLFALDAPSFHFITSSSLSYPDGKILSGIFAKEHKALSDATGLKLKPLCQTE